MAECEICGSSVNRQGKQCTLCELESLITYAMPLEKLLRLKKISMSIEQDILRAEFEREHPRLFHTYAEGC